jgi:hypothetical protein
VGDVGLSTRACIVAGTAGLSAGVSGLALLLVGLVAVAVTAHQALTGKGHDSQAVWLPGFDVGGGGARGQNGDGSDGLEKHLVYVGSDDTIEEASDCWDRNA